MSAPKHPDMERVAQIVRDLREHFDTVQIFATREQEDNFVRDAGLTARAGDRLCR